ncbi:hypothetical protein BJ742DRAFT_802247 [Cladochytrium replicatum]|nr:hypothetical protein BJ742DRAFT_802247 [Cladochytrium replicatum]
MSSPSDIALETAIIHYEALRQYLESYLAQKNAQSGGRNSGQRASAKDKLTRLSKMQFGELSMDVYDELQRRLENRPDVPFLQVRDDFHPKRNQARQKLATLRSSPFRDLAIDVYYELERRYPEAVTVYVMKYGDNLGSRAGPQLMSPPADDGPRSANAILSGQSSPFHDYDYMDAPMSAAPASVRNGPTMPPQNIQNPVNFTRLDNLMSDLGNMLTVPKANGDGQFADGSPEQIRQKYENDIRNLQLKIKVLEEASGSSATDRVRQLEEKLSTQIAVNDKLELSLRKLETDYRKLKDQHENLQEEYKQKLQIQNDMRVDTSNLMEELKLQAAKNEELEVENRKRAEKIKQLQDENRKLELQLRDEFRGGAYMSPPSSRTPGPSSQGEDDGGIIDRERVSAYQNAVEDLLRNARSDNPTTVLVAMKSIVMACKSITEDTEAYEQAAASDTPTVPPLRAEDREHLSDLKDRLSNALTALMAAAKMHATSHGASLVATLDAAASNLTASIVELVRLLRLKGECRGSNGDNSAVFELDELKAFLERQTDDIVQAIQTLLSAMRQTSTLGQEFADTVRTITSIVENLVDVSRSTFANKPSAASFRGVGESILRALEESNRSLDELGTSLINGGPNQSKTQKQRLASSSYEIAKYVKELISLIE